MKKQLYIFFLLFALSSCYTGKQISLFSKKPIELGIEKAAFVSNFGKPYAQEVASINNLVTEKLFYKEELHTGRWYIITTAFHFENSKLIKQEVVKEERAFIDCDCKKNNSTIR